MDQETPLEVDYMYMRINVSMFQIDKVRLLHIFLIDHKKDTLSAKLFLFLFTYPSIHPFIHLSGEKSLLY